MAHTGRRHAFLDLSRAPLAGSFSSTNYKLLVIFNAAYRSTDFKLVPSELHHLIKLQLGLCKEVVQ
jgi:hypothetical protein